MPGDATILEGPVTPAPIFAYRAIRSIFFASPDSSPEHYGKENVVTTYNTSPKKLSFEVTELAQTTPQKRKREPSNSGAILSPTKSILRTPGLATPRAKALRDINVKFKSISPDLRDLENTIDKKGLPTSKTQDAPQAMRPSKLPTTKLVPTTQLSTIEALPSNETHSVPAPPASTCPVPSAQLEAYITQTEKEMKRLIRYGKKMREYALKKDAENQELTAMIETLRKENQRLKNNTQATSKNEATDVETNSHTRARERIKSTAISPALRNKNRGYVREEVDRVELTVRSQTLKDITLQQRTSPVKQLSEKESARSTSSVEAPSKPAFHSLPSRTALSAPDSRQAPPPSPPKATLLHSTTSTNNGTLRLPPDRAAAARERLRLRKEARKASAGGDIDPVGNENRLEQRFEALKGEKKPVQPAIAEEPSDLWANL